MHKEELKNVPLNKIIPYAKNPRINKKAIDKVAESLKTHGYVKTSVGVDEDMVMLYGHTTCKALEKNGTLVVPEVSQITGLSPAQKISYRIADNKTSEYAKWDFDLLYENMKLLEVSKGFTGLDAMGMSAAEIASLRKAHEGAGERPIPEVLETSIKVGDMITLGRHRIICGDCTDAHTVNKLYGDEIVSLVFTSPPYNVGHEGWLGSAESKYEGDTDDSNVSEYLEFLKKFTALNLEHTVYFILNLQMVKGNKLAFIEYLNAVRFNLADIMIWDKQTAQPAMSENILNSQFEFLIALKDSPANRKLGTQKFRGTVSNVYSAPPNRENKYSELHSAAFPMHLPTHIIKSFTNQNEIVCDPFLGTGTTLLACEQLDRTCYGMELNPIYCEITCQRWEEMCKKKRVVNNL